ncbi:HDR084Wp [Eremothecium sinecaudum]|uniref:HDR084Wp n=1 Tax=Eremothecium sinecaudum TaxID=45286 RepID=A0A0X8HSU7_9SACH|nr:HDR084Wp [Eremothecium sinecaudum]AMD20826.1 HDR084Wp [Eremothecium sinecaudum]
MGRRKIAIEPITQDRNRTVTFIKRKAGLFKKAHELAVLCQVDVSVIILGNNNTFYEFSSVDTDDLIKYYKRDDLPHDIKTPADYGDYVKKPKVVLNEKRRRRQATFINEPITIRPSCSKSEQLDDEDLGDNDDDDEEEEDNDEDNDDSIIHNSIAQETDSLPSTEIHQQMVNQRQRTHSPSLESRPFTKRVKSDDSTRFNPLQQHVQRQFHNLYSAASKYIDHPQQGQTQDQHQGQRGHSKNQQSQQQPQQQQHSTQPQQSLSRPKQDLSPSGRSLSSIASSQQHPHQAPQANAKSSFQKPFNPYHSSHKRSSSRGTPIPPNSHTSRSDTHQSSAMPSLSPTGSLQGSSQQQSTGKQVTRPVLRVQIPNSNSTGSLNSQPSSNSMSEVIGVNKPSQFNANGHLVLPDPSNPRSDIPVSSHPQDVSGGLMVSERPKNAENMTSAGTGMLYNNLPSAIAASPSMRQYFASPLQQAANGAGNLLSASHNQTFQSGTRQTQTTQHRKHQADQSAGPMLGALPSKYVSDLMVASPNGSIAMFQDWPFNRGAPNTGGNTAFGSNSDSLQASLVNSNTGLTPYINGSVQTPLGGRYFNFPNEPHNEDKVTEEKP